MGKYEFKPTNRQAKRKHANAGHERGKAKNICMATFKAETIVQRKFREEYEQRVAAGTAGPRQANGSYWGYHIPITT